ncbi:MAG: hypothetical protein IK152_00690 [Lachnospiraceae bacterium]|nr:hypothetical protein [Lachnospiraceae bacterium]
MKYSRFSFRVLKGSKMAAVVLALSVLMFCLNATPVMAEEATKPIFLKANGKQASRGEDVYWFCVPYNSGYDNNGKKIPRIVPMGSINDYRHSYGNPISSSIIENARQHGASYAMPAGWGKTGTTDSNDNDNTYFFVVFTDSPNYVIENGYYKIRAIGMTYCDDTYKGYSETHSFSSKLGDRGFNNLAKWGMKTHTHDSNGYEAPTCTKGGRYYCSGCGITMSEVAALGHARNSGVQTKAPTCTEEGLITYSCGRCGITMGSAAAPALGHVWDSGAVTTAPDLYRAGIMTYTCRRNTAHKRTETIPKKHFEIYSGTERISKIYAGETLIMNVSSGSSSMVR